MGTFENSPIDRFKWPKKHLQTFPTTTHFHSTTKIGSELTRILLSNGGSLLYKKVLDMCASAAHLRCKTLIFTKDG